MVKRNAIVMILLTVNMIALISLAVSISNLREENNELRREAVMYKGQMEDILQVCEE